MAGTEVGSLYYDLNIDDKNLKKQLDDADKSVKGFGDKVSKYWGDSVDASRKFGLALTAVTAGVVAFGVSSVKSFQESQNVMAQTEAVLKSTGNAAGITAKQVTDLATALERQTKFADEDVQKVENLLLTFTSIGKDIFPQATKTVLDMATALGEDTSSASIQLGKALQDPILGVTALRRVGVNFNSAQQEVIANLVNTGKSAEAQQMILKELNKEFGGSAVAAGNTFAGQLAKLNNQLDNVKEAIGGMIATLAVPFLTAIMNWFYGIGGVDGVLKLLKDTLEKIKPYLPEIAGVILGMLVPALVAAAIAAGEFLLTLLPWALAGLAVVEVGKKMGVTWEDVRKVLEKVKIYANDVWIGLRLIKDTVTGADPTLKAGEDRFAGIAKALIGLRDIVVDTVHTLEHLWSTFVNSTPVIVFVQFIQQVFWPALQAIAAAVWQNLLPALLQLWQALTRLWNALNPALMDALKIVAAIIGITLLVAIWAILAVLNVLIQVFSMVVSAISNVINWIANAIGWFGNFVGVVWNAIRTVISILWNLPAAARDVLGLIGSIFGGIGGMIKNAFGDAYHLLYDFGKWVLWGLKDGIMSVIGSIKDVAGNIGNAIKDKVKGILGIHSPSKVFHEIGQNVTAGFVNGVKSSIHLASSAMTGFTNSIQAPAMELNGAAAGGASVPTTHNYGSTIFNIGSIQDRQDADYIINRADQNQRLQTRGVAPL